MKKTKPTNDFPSLKGQGMIAIDLETCDPGLHEWGPGYHRDGFIAGIAVGTESGFRKYYPVAHEGGGNMERKKVLGWLQDQMKLDVPKVGANLLYDLGYLKVAGIDVRGPLYDIQIAEPLLNENRFNYSLETIAQAYLKEGKRDDAMEALLKERFNRKKKKEVKSDIWRLHGDEARDYAEGDVDLPLKIFELQKPKLVEQKLWALFNLESKLIPMLLAMRLRGVKVDLDRAEQLHAKFTAMRDKQLAEIQKLSKEDASVWAAKDLAMVFDTIGVDYPRTPKTKQPSFTQQFLDRCDHPIAKKILEVRKLDKLCTTFLEGCVLEGHWKGRIHCQFNQLKGEDGGTVSGRFSSSNPNLQFIPQRTADGKLIRGLFIPDDGQLWWKKDYSQIEYRLMVHDAGTLKLKGAKEVVQKYLDDPKADFHSVVAEMTGLSRTAAKTINFGLAYGEGVDKLSASLGLTLEKGKELIEEYHRRAPFMRPLSKNAMVQAASTGLITTLMGRRRRFDRWEVRKWDEATKKFTSPEILNHRVPGAQRAFTYSALNARIQGGAADIMKKAMVDVWESGACDVIGVPQLTVHDELDGSVPKTREGMQALQHINDVMENVIKLLVPLKVDGNTAVNWGACKDGVDELQTYVTSRTGSKAKQRMSR